MARIELFQHGGRGRVVERRDLLGCRIGTHLGVDRDQRRIGAFHRFVMAGQNVLDLGLLGFEGCNPLGDLAFEVVQFPGLQRETRVGRGGRDVLAIALSLARGGRPGQSRRDGRVCRVLGVLDRAGPGAATAGLAECGGCAERNASGESRVDEGCRKPLA